MSTCRVVFNTVLGREQHEVVKYTTDASLESWIKRYKRAYCPGAAHYLAPVGNVKLSDGINHI